MTLVADVTTVVLPVGDTAVLLEVPPDVVPAIASAVRRARIPALVEVIPAARTVLLVAELGRVSAVVDAVLAVPLDAVGSAAGRVITIDTVYDGEDLGETATALGLSVDALVEYHSSRPWTAAFPGFAPGFVYLTRPDALPVPRRDTPRTRVPAGSVAIADGFGGIYPSESPGGWQLLGRTTAPLWDAQREPPALITAGDTVRFVPVRELVTAAQTPVPLATPSARTLTILDPGMQALVQDLGREGAAVYGVSRSGALDRAALRAGNRLVGNAAGAAGIEFVLGIGVRAEGDLVVALTGAVGEARVRAGEEWRSVDAYAPVLLDDGEELVVNPAAHGFRGYLSVAGGVAVDTELGSASTDVLGGLGPKALRAGGTVPIGAAAGVAGVAETAPAPADVVLRVVPGPRSEWFAPGALESLVQQNWTVTAQSNRVGLRLRGTVLERADAAELPSEGMVPGAIQVPPSGQPVLFLRDAPITGGYPVLAVVVSTDLDRAAQAAPGTTITFRL